MVNNFQREGPHSNAKAGSDFETTAQTYFQKQGVLLEKGLSVLIGVADTKKKHEFDLRSSSPPVLVECKSHKWRSGGNVPSAKITVWNEAMYYFHLAPPEYRKILFVLRDYSDKRRETLAQYYIRNHGHLIPDDVEIFEFNGTDGTTVCLRPTLNRVRPEVMAHFRTSMERNRRLGQLLAQ